MHARARSFRTASAAALAALALAGTPVVAQDAGDRDLGFSLGSSDATVTIVEYGDFACSACALFARDTWPAVRNRYVETGKVVWRMVPFELGFRNSEEGLRAALCAADQDAFWPMHDLLFERRDDWVDERNPGDALRGLATEAGIDGDRFERCYESGAMDDRMDAAKDAARRRGVRGTPTFFIDGVPVQGALPKEDFITLVEGALRGSMDIAGRRPSR